MAEEKLSVLLDQCKQMMLSDRPEKSHRSIVCKYGILRGLKIPIKESNQEYIQMCKKKAKNIEFNIEQKRQEQMRSWKMQAKQVEYEVQKRHSSKLHASCTTNNDISCKSSIDSNCDQETVSSYDDYSGCQFSRNRNIIPALSLESVTFKDIISESNLFSSPRSFNNVKKETDVNSNTLITKETYPKAFVKSTERSLVLSDSYTISTRQSIDTEVIAEINNSNPETALCGDCEDGLNISAKIIKEKLQSQRSNAVDNISSNNINPIETIGGDEKVAGVLNDNMKSLQGLQEQQEKLDLWYENMQKQLDLEKIMMAEKYDELKLKNIREQQKLIDNSHNVLEHSTLLFNQSTAKNNVSHGQGGSNQTPVKKNLISTQTLYKPNHSFKMSPNSVSNTSSYQNNLSNPETKKNEVFSSPVFQHKLHKESDVCGSSSGNENLVNLRKLLVVDKVINENDHFKELKMRRKSRPIKFFTTPTSNERKQDVAGYDNSLDNSLDHLKEQLERKETLTSTPQEDFKNNLETENVSQSSYRSPYHVPFNEKQVGYKKKDLSTDFNSVMLTEEDLYRLRDIVVSVIKGYFVRQLMKTSKVQSVIKTIKDTELCLCDMNKENSLRMTQVSNADKQLKSRLEDELKTKRELFYNIFFKYGTCEQMKILSQARLQKQEKLIQSTFPSKSEPVKKLSKASQRSILRRKTSDSRPKTAPPLTVNPSTKKSRDIAKRPLRPIQSCSSPVMSDRMRPKTAEPLKSAKKVVEKNKPVKKVLQKKPTSAKKLVMTANPKKNNLLNARTMAAEFKKRTSSQP